MLYSSYNTLTASLWSSNKRNYVKDVSSTEHYNIIVNSLSFPKSTENVYNNYAFIFIKIYIIRNNNRFSFKNEVRIRWNVLKIS